MALQPCVKSILCGLALPVLRALDSLLNFYIVELNATIAALVAQLAVIDIIVIPINLTAGLAQEAVEQVRSAANVLPLSLVEGCANLGDLNLTINSFAEGVVADVRDIQQDLVGRLSMRDKLEAELAKANIQINEFTALREVVAECIQAKGGGGG